MTTMNTSADLFGEEWQGYEVQTFTVRDGNGFYISHTVDNTRTVFTQYEILVRYSDGTEDRTYATSQQELELWTKHLN
jgi:hypothetical protein